MFELSALKSLKVCLCQTQVTFMTFCSQRSPFMPAKAVLAEVAVFTIHMLGISKWYFSTIKSATVMVLKRSHLFGQENGVPQQHPLLDWLLWRNKLCELLNSVCYVFAVGRIGICSPREAIDCKLLGDDNLRALVVVKMSPMHMSLIWQPLCKTRHLNGRVLADIVQVSVENMMSSSKDKLMDVSKAPYKSICKKKSHDLKASKFLQMTSDEVGQTMSYQKCCDKR